MPKIRTNRAAAKRFRLTGGGHVRRYKACASHLLTKKSAKRKRNLRKATLVSASDTRRALRLLGR
ncbi:MAG: 50S ribosomal protein L35 [candidate division KSB1 bacterium]|nr:50S ribosomal protein L35 [candidate division KSB1 bacterium]MDZ7378327.1 50S ribosomal protein L35 [candidate division KSB1 bacterium]